MFFYWKYFCFLNMILVLANSFIFFFHKLKSVETIGLEMAK